MSIDYCTLILVVVPIASAMPDMTSFVDQNNKVSGTYYVAFYWVNVFFSILNGIETICIHVDNSFKVLPQGYVILSSSVTTYFKEIWTTCII